jgi:pimeloyl-ACP methyl ester carboxylesterase
MGAGAQPPIFDLLHRFEKPTLLVVGEEDEKFQGIAQQLASGMPNARISVIPEAGHAAHLEAPDEFARVVGEFLATTRRQENDDE